MKTRKPTSRRSLHPLGSGTLTTDAQEALRWLAISDEAGKMTCAKARATIAERWGGSVSAELAALRSGYRKAQRRGGTKAMNELTGKCPACNGRGWNRYELENFGQCDTCKKCKGTGRITKDPSPAERTKTIHVCAACKAEFRTKGECWHHMDNACPERRRDSAESSNRAR